MQSNVGVKSRTNRWTQVDGYIYYTYRWGHKYLMTMVKDKKRLHNDDLSWYRPIETLQLCIDNLRAEVASIPNVIPVHLSTSPLSICLAFNNLLWSSAVITSDSFLQMYKYDILQSTYTGTPDMQTPSSKTTVQHFRPIYGIILHSTCVKIN